MKTTVQFKGLFTVLFLAFAMMLTVNFSLYSQQQNEKDIDDDEDLFDASTDYQEMYKDLSNDGEWIQLTKSELTEQTSEDDGTGSGFSNKNEADGMRIVFVWRPRGYYSGWTPYSNGRWIYTDCNWYWHSYYSWGWGPYHYGRWVYSYMYGWIWIPGRYWAPSWVDWCYTDYYVGWYPRYPRFHRTFNYHRYYERHYDHWVFVDRDKMLDPKINKNLILGSETNKEILSKSNINTQTNKYLDGKIVSAGPPVKDIEKTMGKKIDTKHIDFTDTKDNSKVVKKDIVAYKPDKETGSKNSDKNVVSSRNNDTGSKTKETSTKTGKKKDVTSTKNDTNKDVTSTKNNGSKNKDKITKTENVSKKNNKVTKTKNENPVTTNYSENRTTRKNTATYEKQNGTRTKNNSYTNRKQNTGSREKFNSQKNVQRRQNENIQTKQYTGSRGNKKSR